MFLELLFQKYIISLSNIDNNYKPFLLRQLQRMPDYYRFGVKLICIIVYILRLKPWHLNLLNKLISSLATIKKYES